MPKITSRLLLIEGKRAKLLKKFLSREKNKEGKRKCQISVVFTVVGKNF
jgi:hypothetical protein